MAKILLMIAMAAASLAAKDRAWQTGQLLDSDLNPYFKAASGNGNAKPSDGTTLYPFAVGVNVNHSSGNVAYDDYVIAGDDTVYMVEFTRLKSFMPPHLSLSRPLSYAVEKNRLWIKDLDKAEFETQILKQTPKTGSKPGDVVAGVQVKPAPAEPNPAPPKPAAKPEAVQQAKVQPVRVEPPKTELVKTEATKPETPKADPLKTEASKPEPAKADSAKAAPPKAPAKPDPVLVASVQKPTPAPPRPEVKAAPPPAPKPEPKPVAKPEAASARAQKERAWQSGQLLSIVSNSYFFNVTYSSDTDGGAWPFVQGSDGRYTVNGQIGNPTSSLYTYDNYVIESQFCVYLVQRMRPKTSVAVRLPGSKPLKFAVEKSKLWVLDEDNIEYETKVVKLVQKDAIVDPLTRAAAK